MSPGAKTAVDTASPAKRLSLIVTIMVAEELARIARIQDPTERSRQLRVVYHDAKQPLLDEFHEYAKGGIKVVNALEGTPQIIVSAPARTWRQIFASSSPALNDPKVSVQSNDPVWSVDPVG